MNEIQKIYNLILEMDKLKFILRTTITTADRKESSAEHSWSASMIVLILMEELRAEFGELDELKAIKLALIHDTVEVYAGDVIAFDAAARKDKEKIEGEALKKLMSVYPDFGKQLHDLWHESEKRETIEAKIAKAADAICPIFQRLLTKQSYIPFDINISRLDKTKCPHLTFSKAFSALYEKLKADLLKEGLILSD